jgi:aryl-alcohol dehydrogenase-like predicted oxidoreductase
MELLVSSVIGPRSGGVSAAASGTFRLGGDLDVRRLGYGAMRITGKGVWGPPSDPEGAVAVLRRAVELGVTLIDTADSYGPQVSEELIARALHPYPAGLVIATKGGFERSGPNRWETNGRPAHLREACEGSLRRLRLEQIPLYQLHRIDPKVPAADSLGELARLQQEGKILHIGLSEVSVAETAHARTIVPIVSVQNRYNLAERTAEDVLDYCEREGLGFLPWFPLLTGKLAEPGGPVAAAAERLGATPAQVALAWLLKRSPVMLPIPGTSSVEHLDENVAAAALRLTDEQFRAIEG